MQKFILFFYQIEVTLESNQEFCDVDPIHESPAEVRRSEVIINVDSL
jgi:hypothetical protein